jgi:hypothetical protein
MKLFLAFWLSCFLAHAAPALLFVPLAPCRAYDTRPNPIKANATRDFPIGGKCGVPASAAAYSLNITVVPKGPLGYLSAWPTPDRPIPDVSILNSQNGQIVANAAILPAGVNGSITVLVTDPSDIIIDVNGYFTPPELKPDPVHTGELLTRQADGTYTFSTVTCKHAAVFRNGLRQAKPDYALTGCRVTPVLPWGAGDSVLADWVE